MNSQYRNLDMLERFICLGDFKGIFYGSTQPIYLCTNSGNTHFNCPCLDMTNNRIFGCILSASQRLVPASHHIRRYEGGLEPSAETLVSRGVHISRLCIWCNGFFAGAFGAIMLFVVQLMKT